MSITLPAEVLRRIDRASDNRSAFVERACRAYVARLAKAKRESRDVAIVKTCADQLNKEALDILDYQVWR